MSVQTTVHIPATGVPFEIGTLYFIVINSMIYYTETLDKSPTREPYFTGQSLHTMYPFHGPAVAIPIPLYLALQLEWIDANELPVNEPARALAKMLGF